MVRRIFKNLVLSAAGPLPGQLTVDNLKQWTQLRKGVFTTEFDETTTHLLCTREQFNKKVPLVREALKRGKSFHIVHYDWFEFSAVKEKKLPEKEYSMRVLISKKRAREREESRIEKGRRDADKLVNTNLFHIYRDREFFAYQVDITREESVLGEPGQRYTLCLWESDAKPHLYQFTAKFLRRKGDSQPSYYRPSPCAGKWRTEMDFFMDFFHKKTGMEWVDRVIKQKTTGDKSFQYTPPSGGKPVGRRLRHSLEYCLQINAELRGLPWPPPKEQGEAAADSAQASGDILAIQGGSDQWETEDQVVPGEDHEEEQKDEEEEKDTLMDHTDESQSKETENQAEVRGLSEGTSSSSVDEEMASHSSEGQSPVTSVTSDQSSKATTPEEDAKTDSYQRHKR